MGKSIFKVKGLDSLQRDLKKIQRKIKKYDGEHQIPLSYSQEQWDNMTESERNEAIEETKNEFIKKIKKDVFD